MAIRVTFEAQIMALQGLPRHEARSKRTSHPDQNRTICAFHSHSVSTAGLADVVLDGLGAAVAVGHRKEEGKERDGSKKRGVANEVRFKDNPRVEMVRL